ncbi:DegQ family serine endoprotease [Sulfuriferula thiophila]|uniref:DegQ family serine endoprotease n=1 Tax=Sulfuriferula thiophila TaxID=1781211 RepID=UPI00167A12AC|nr:DegQ family serine endoprotease [Sulfuriferula thiophila]
MKKLLFLGFFLINLSFTAFAKDLPDFTELVKQHGASVVNITTTQLVKSNNGFGNMPGFPNDEMFDFFRRFMPPPDAAQNNREIPVRSGGSGFIISADGYILTNAHVVDGADEVMVKLTDRREFKAKVIGTDPRSDIALIKIAATNLPKVPIGDSAQLQVGEWVIAIGSPFGFENSVTAGIVSAKGRSLPSENYVPFIQTDVAVNPGNSGGPLFNMKGEVVGINSQIFSRSGGYMGVSFAIPIDVAMQVADQLKTQGKVRRGRLGVVIQDVSAGNASAFGLSRPEGALVSEVEKDSPAAKGGVKAGDVILKFNGQSISRSIDLPRLVAASKPGSLAKLQVWRNRAVTDLSVTVAEASEPKTIANKPVKSGKIPNKIGLVLSDLNKASLSQLGISHGIAVESSDGIAARAGIQAGDIIMGVGSISITSAEQFNTVIANTHKNSSLALLIKREDSTLYIPLQIE